MMLRWNAGHLLCICSILLQTFATPIALGCPPVDEDGNPFDPNTPVPALGSIWVCSYLKTGACTYDTSNVSHSYRQYDRAVVTVELQGELFNSASASTSCPRVAILQ
jgi:hypothetical protein